MNRNKVEVTRKTASSTTVKQSSTVVTKTTTWKSEQRSSSSGKFQDAQSMFSGGNGAAKSAFSIGPASTRGLDATMTYRPVYPQAQQATQPKPPNLLTSTSKNLFYTFPKPSDQEKYPPPVKYTTSINNKAPTISATNPRPSTSVVPASRPVPSITVPRPLQHSHDAYSQSYLKSRRLVYIMNHYDYVKGLEDKREGSKEDVRSLKEAFNRFNVTIKERHDQTKAQILEMAWKQSMKNYRGFDFIIYIIMTHGGTDKTLSARDATYSLEKEFIQQMAPNPSWQGVPKVYIIQACRGRLQTDALVEPRKSVAPNDTLKLFSTYEGYVSYRTTQGTYFIQELCQKIKEYGNTEELMAIMRRVTQEVSKRAQTPEQSSTLQKALYLGKITS